MCWKTLGVLGLALSAGATAALADGPTPFLPGSQPVQQASSMSSEVSATANITDSIFSDSGNEIEFVSCEENMYCPPAPLGIPGVGNAGGAGGAAAHTKYPTVALTGFAQIDALYFDQDGASKANNGNINDYAGFRRARLAAKGQLTENTGYYLEMDFAFPGRPSFMDVWVEQQNIPVLGNVRIGQFREPLSMEALTSVRDLMFLERALPFAFIPFRQIGVMSYNTALDDNMTWAASVYRFPTDTYGNAYSDSGYGTSYRVTGIPIYDEACNQVLHLGLGYSYNKFGSNTNGTPFGGFRQSPEVGYNIGASGAGGFTGPIFASTGALATATADNLFNVELAYAYESFLVQSEFFDVVVQDPTGNQNYTGAYVMASYVLTGEHHKYNKKAAAFGRVVPHRNLGACGWGAWELAGRWSYIDLRDTPNVPGVPPVVGAYSATYLTDLTLGLNWYWNPYAKMQFNYIHAFQNIKDNGAGVAANTNTNIFGVRTQFDF